VLSATSHFEFLDSRYRAAVFVERRFRCQLMWRHRLLFDSRFRAPQRRSTNVAVVYLSLEGAFATARGVTTEPVAYALAQSEIDRVVPGAPWFRTWGDPAVVLELELAPQDVRVPIGLEHGPLRISRSSWAALEAIAEKVAVDEVAEAEVAQLMAALIGDDVIASVLGDIVVEEPEYLRRLWAVLTPFYSSGDPAPTIAKLVLASGLSPRQLGRDLPSLLKTFSLLGTGFRDASRVARIRLATLLLSAPEATVSDVATRVGYRNVDAMAKAFRQLGLPAPSDIRAKVIYPVAPS
jgi:AraC-like DNA-binding protein